MKRWLSYIFITGIKGAKVCHEGTKEVSKDFFEGGKAC